MIEIKENVVKKLEEYNGVTRWKIEEGGKVKKDRLYLKHWTDALDLHEYHGKTAPEILEDINDGYVDLMTGKAVYRLDETVLMIETLFLQIEDMDADDKEAQEETRMKVPAFEGPVMIDGRYYINVKMLWIEYCEQWDDRCSYVHGSYDLKNQTCIVTMPPDLYEERNASYPLDERYVFQKE